MQDRFKFRFWHKPTKRMLNAYSFTDDFVFEETRDGINPVPSKDCVLMPCTGLKDKNGELIYEGDIVLWESVSWKSIRYKVVWNGIDIDVPEYITGSITDCSVDSDVISHSGDDIDIFEIIREADFPLGKSAFSAI